MEREEIKNQDYKYKESDFCKTLETVCQECPEEIPNYLQKLYIYSEMSNEENILRVTNNLTKFLVVQEDLPPEITSDILYMTTRGILPVLNEKVRRNKSLDLTKNLIRYKYGDIYENFDKIKEIVDEKDSQDCEYAKMVLSFLGVCESRKLNRAGFPGKKLL